MVLQGVGDRLHSPFANEHPHSQMKHPHSLKTALRTGQAALVALAVRRNVHRVPLLKLGNLLGSEVRGQAGGLMAWS